MKVVIRYLFTFLLALFVSILIYKSFNNDNNTDNVTKHTPIELFIAGDKASISVYNDKFEEIKTISRGTKITSNNKKLINDEKSLEYQDINYDDDTYYIEKINLTDNIEKVILESNVYVRTPVTVYEASDTSKIVSFISKGTKVDVIGYSNLNDNGTVEMYKIKYNDVVGYIYGKYTVSTEALALKNYDEDGNYKIHAGRGNTLGGGSAANLDYYPYEKAKFENNIMPDVVRSLYLNGGVISNVDKYIEFAKNNNINAFVIDIKDNTAPAYASPVMKEYSPTNYKYAINSLEDYQKYIKKFKDAGFYVIGRITTFKDDYYALDHPEDTIFNTKTNSAFLHNGSKWPSAFDRDVWQFNVELAKEAVTLIGFNEIQFDYVRFPDRVGSSTEKILDYHNAYNEEKAQAIQNFLFYACDQIHSVGGYVSADVFGESAHNYVSAYGQYWSAISNVVDVISGMPYPEAFNKYEYGFKTPVWTIPYELVKFWGKNYALKQQSIIPTPAIARTWIEVYDITWKDPVTYYGADKVFAQIKGLYDAGLTGGYITWNASSSVSKYNSVSSAFTRNYTEGG